MTKGNLTTGAVVSKFNVTTLISAAKEAGLQVIPLDTSKTYKTSNDIGNTCDNNNSTDKYDGRVCRHRAYRQQAPGTRAGVGRA